MILKALENILPRFDARNADPASVRSVQDLAAAANYHSIAGRDILKLLERSGASPVTDSNIEIYLRLLGTVHVTAFELEQMRDLAMFWMSLETQAGSDANRTAWQRLIKEIDWLFDAKTEEQREAAKQVPKKYAWQELAA